jgi:hypothetical protein
MRSLSARKYFVAVVCSQVVVIFVIFDKYGGDRVAQSRILGLANQKACHNAFK